MCGKVSVGVWLWGGGCEWEGGFGCGSGVSGVGS